MKSTLILCVLVAAAVAFPADTYNSRFDNFNAQEVVENDRLLVGYGHCFTGEGPCTADGKSIKKIIPEALRTNCAKCTPKQRELVRIMAHAFKTKQPEIWTNLVNKVDPKGEFVEAFEKFLARND